jgi:hypothetical protein
VRLVKKIEHRLDSVRKERETAISFIEGIIKSYFSKSNQYENSQFISSNYVGIRMYGSMASGLAIE